MAISVIDRDHFKGGKYLSSSDSNPAERELGDLIVELQEAVNTIQLGGFGAGDYFVDADANASVADGTFLFPYTTIGDAMTAIGAPTTTAEARKKITVHIKAGQYDEDVVTPIQRMLTFMCHGTVVLGDGAADDMYNSTTPRSLTVQNTATDEPADAPQRPAFCIKGNAGEVSSTHHAYGLGNMIISGDLIFSHVDGNTTSHETFLSGVKVQGDVTRDANEAGCVHNLTADKCFFDSTFNADNCNLCVVESCEFDGLITASTVGRFVNCEIGGGLTAGVGDYYPPNGFFGCDVSGGTTWTITGVPVDSVTEKQIVDNGVTVTGGTSVIE